jgi:hypothetical protein
MKNKYHRTYSLLKRSFGFCTIQFRTPRITVGFVSVMSEQQAIVRTPLVSIYSPYKHFLARMTRSVFNKLTRNWNLLNEFRPNQYHEGRPSSEHRSLLMMITVFFFRYNLKRRVSGRRLEASCRQGDVEVKRSNEKYCEFVLRATEFMQLKCNKL